MNSAFRFFQRLAFWVALSGVLAFIGDYGFRETRSTDDPFNYYYYFVLAIGLLATVLRYIFIKQTFRRMAFVFDLLSVLLSVLILYSFIRSSSAEASVLNHHIWVKVAVLFTFIREFSELRINYKRAVLNPAQLLIVSFLAIIFIGSWLLMLPNATVEGISYLDAFFTSTSAVCVTGLAVVDTGTRFTLFGQTLIMLLIQIGGLGILTFAGYFSYFFKGGTTYENQLVLGDMTGSQKLGEVFSMLKYILFITFGIELFAAVLIYFSLDAGLFDGTFDQIYFAVFHAVSAFCNAGFSTLSAGMYDAGFKFNYPLQLVVIFTFVLGGLGFPIVVNILSYVRYRLGRLWRLVGRARAYRPWVLNINSRFTLITTLSISAVAFVAFFILEYNNTLSEHGFLGKMITALFGATTPRTAGFNTIDTAAMAFPTVMLVILLMWIGASPASTGGGIKTGTFAIAVLNIISLARGKTRVEVFRREIADISVRRAFATISLSLLVIGAGILMMTVFDSDKDLKAIAFECFSAYSTVGLSLNLTPSLSPGSKAVLIVIMFVGRVSMLSVAIAVFRKVKHKHYRYPTEEITIN